MDIIIWGTGKFGSWAYDLLREYNITGYVDSAPEIVGTKFKDFIVWSKEELIDKYNGEVVVITPRGFEAEIGKWLDEKKIFNHYAFEEELWGLHAFIKQVNKTKLLEDIKKDSSWILYPKSLLSLVVEKWLSSNKKEVQIVDNVLETENANLIITKLLSPTQKETIEGKKILDYSNLSLRDDLFYYPELSAFKDICKGQRCFIVATGPSLKIEDLDTLKNNNEKCFGVNGILFAFDKTAWRPNYYCISDHNGLFMWLDKILSMNVNDKFVSDLGWMPELFDRKKEFHKWHFKSEWIRGVKPKFNVDITHGLYWARTVVCDICIPLAIYMGFKEIYLLGTDCTHDKDPDKRHFVANYDRGKVSKAQRLEIDEIMLSYQVAKEYADEHDIKIYNATRGGALEVFPRVDFDSLFVQ